MTSARIDFHVQPGWPHMLHMCAQRACAFSANRRKVARQMAGWTWPCHLGIGLIWDCRTGDSGRLIIEDRRDGTWQCCNLICPYCGIPAYGPGIVLHSVSKPWLVPASVEGSWSSPSEHPSCLQSRTCVGCISIAICKAVLNPDNDVGLGKHTSISSCEAAGTVSWWAAAGGRNLHQPCPAGTLVESMSCASAPTACCERLKPACSMELLQ